MLGIWGTEKQDATRVVADKRQWKAIEKLNDAAEDCTKCAGCGRIAEADAWDVIGADDEHVICPECHAQTPNVPCRPRVFLGSLMDIFEDWSGPMVDSRGNFLLSHFSKANRITMQDVRNRVFALIDRCPNVDFLLLTKRPQNIRRMWPSRQQHESEHYYCEEPYEDSDGWHDGVHRCRPDYRDNVWLITSVSTAPDADANIPELLRCRDLSPVLGVSAEPLLEPIFGLSKPCKSRQYCEDVGCWTGLDWIIIGGESGPDARPYNLEWPRSIIRQCRDAGVAVFHKQVGSRPYHCYGNHDIAAAAFPGPSPDCLGNSCHPQPNIAHPKGGDPSEWPEDVRVREYPR